MYAPHVISFNQISKGPKNCQATGCRRWLRCGAVQCPLQIFQPVSSAGLDTSAAETRDERGDEQGQAPTDTQAQLKWRKDQPGARRPEPPSSFILTPSILMKLKRGPRRTGQSQGSQTGLRIALAPACCLLPPASCPAPAKQTVIRHSHH